jgi:hypothetical protein
MKHSLTEIMENPNMKFFNPIIVFLNFIHMLSCTPATSEMNTANQSPDSGIHVGYYAEDPTTNTEDPTLGAFVLKLPTESNATFRGSMYFTYLGCQSENTGQVAGTKTTNGISGTFSGLVDAFAMSGTYSGIFNSSTTGYEGTYLIDQGKVHQVIPSCIDYYIGPNGTWKMYPIGKYTPSNFTLTLNGRTVTWPSLSGALATLTYITDPAQIQSGNNSVLWQTIQYSGLSAIIPPSVTLTSGKTYVVAVTTSGASSVLGFSSTQFVAP